MCSKTHGYLCLISFNRRFFFKSTISALYIDSPLKMGNIGPRIKSTFQKGRKQTIIAPGN